MPRLAPLATAVLLFSAPSSVLGQAQEERPALEARVWLDRGAEPVLQRGDQVRVYYRASDDAYAAIFRIDTDGVVSMLLPQHPGATDPVLGGRDYRLLFPDAPTWGVGDDPGAGYFFMVASPEPLDFSLFGFDPVHGWDLSAVGTVVYEDPYVAIDDYVAAIVPDWEVVPYALDFLTYHVGNTYSYPRFLCYDCHTRESYHAWNPYDAVCTSFRVVIWDDPYFYPSYRYLGTRVVVARPARALPRYELVTRARTDIGVRPIVRARAAPERRVAQFKEDPTERPASAAPVRRNALSAPSGGAATRVGGSDQEAPQSVRNRPTLERRPAATLPVRTPPTRTAPSETARGVPTRPSGGDRPTASPRPSAPRAGTGAAPASGTDTRGSTRGSVAPSRTRPSAPVRGATSGRPGASQPPEVRPAAPSRPTARGVPAPSRGSARPAPTTRPTPRAAPTRPSGGSGQAAPSRPSGRPATPSTGRAPPRAAPAPRSPASRPTVRPRRPARGN